jgi:hypothetical protein
LNINFYKLLFNVGKHKLVLSFQVVPLTSLRLLKARCPFIKLAKLKEVGLVFSEAKSNYFIS